MYMEEIEFDEALSQTYVGTLKWFDPLKGYGFLTCFDLDEDILLHVKKLETFGKRTVHPNSEIVFTVEEGESGYRVEKIISVNCDLAESIQTDPSDSASIPLVPARIKWFDTTKGFGFANAFKDATDIFLHSSVANQYGVWNLISGEAVCLRVEKTDRGMIAVDILPWESQTKQEFAPDLLV